MAAPARVVNLVLPKPAAWLPRQDADPASHGHLASADPLADRPRPRHHASMTAPPHFDPEALARQAAAAIGLPLHPAHLPGVTMNLGLAARMAALVEAVPLTPADEAAPVFDPGRRVAR